jgi:hypothetical protein
MIDVSFPHLQLSEVSIISTNVEAFVKALKQNCLSFTVALLMINDLLLKDSSSAMLLQMLC